MERSRGAPQSPSDYSRTDLLHAYAISIRVLPCRHDTCACRVSHREDETRREGEVRRDAGYVVSYKLYCMSLSTAAYTQLYDKTVTGVHLRTARVPRVIVNRPSRARIIYIIILISLATLMHSIMLLVACVALCRFPAG